MATFEPISYQYKPTVPRSKRTAKQTKPAQKPSSIFHQIQHNPNGTAMDRPGPQPVVAPANEARWCNLEIQENDTAGSGGDRHNDDAEFPTIEEILFTKLQQENIVTDNQRLDNPALQSEVETKEHSWSVSSRKSTLGTTLGRRQDEPSEQLGSHSSSVSEAEADKINLRVEDMAPDLGPCDNSESIHGRTLALPRSSGIWHDIDDFEFPESPRPRVAVQGTSVSYSTNPRTSSLCLSSEPIDNCSQPGASVPHAESLLRRQSSALPDEVLGQGDGCVTSGGRVDDPELEAVGPALGVHPDSGEIPQQVLEQRRDEAGDGDGDDKQEGHNAAVVATGKIVDGSNSFEDENGRSGAAERQYSPSNSPLDPRCDEAGIVSDDEPTNTHPDSRDGRPVDLKRKRHVSSHNIATSKRPKHQAQQRRLKGRTPSNPSRSSPKRHGRLGHTWRGSANASATGQLPSPTSPESGTINTELTHDCGSLGGSSGDALPTLTEITFRPHSPRCYSFTAVIQEGCEGRRVSFSQLTQLLDNVGLGRTEDIMIKPQEQHSLLLTGFSRYPLSQLPHKRKLVEIAMDSNRTRGTIPVVEIRQCKGTDFGMMAPEKVGSSGSDEDNASDINDGTPELSSDEDRDLSKARQRYSSRRNHLAWSELDKQRAC